MAAYIATYLLPFIGFRQSSGSSVWLSGAKSRTCSRPSPVTRKKLSACWRTELIDCCIPHYIVLAFLEIGAIVVVIIAWFAILFTGRYPRGMFDFVQGVMRWVPGWPHTRSSWSPTDIHPSRSPPGRRVARWKQP